MATSTVCAVSVAAPVADVSKLSSSNAFQASTSSVHLAPVTSKKANRAFAVRAGLSEQKSARREVLASILATGAAFTVAEAAFAGHNSASSGGNAAKALEDVKKQAGGLFGNNPFQSGKDKVASSADKAGSSFGKASDKIKNLKPVGNTLARPERSSFEEKTGEAKKKASSFGSDLQKQGEKVIGQAQKSVKGKLPEIPKPGIGKLFGDAPKKAGSVGSDVQKQGGSAVGQAKDSAKGNAPNLPKKPDIGGFFGSFQGFGR